MNGINSGGLVEIASTNLRHTRTPRPAQSKSQAKQPSTILFKEPLRKPLPLRQPLPLPLPLCMRCLVAEAPPKPHTRSSESVLVSLSQSESSESVTVVEAI